MSATALVVGSTGTLGAPVVRRLLEDGLEVRVLVRDSTAEFPAGARAVRGDVTDNDPLRKAITGCELVHVNLRGGPREHDFETVEHHGAARVARIAADCGVAHLTYVSHMLAAQDAPAASLRAKAAGEAAIRATGVPATILRPTYFMETLPRHVRGTRAIVIGRQPPPLHLLAAKDFAAMVSSALSSEELVGQAVAARGPEAITLADALRRYCAARAAGVTVVTRPLRLMTVLDRTVLRGQLDDTIKLMRVLQAKGEGDTPLSDSRLPTPATTLQQWCDAQPA